MLTEADVKISPSTYYAAKGGNRPRGLFAMKTLKPQIGKVHRDNYGVYGTTEVHAQLNRKAVGARTGAVAA